MDVHKKTVILALLKETGEIIGETKIPEMSWIFQERINDDDVQIKTGYEAGCLERIKR